MAVCRRNPKGWTDGHRRAALLVVAVLLCISTASSSRLARLAPESSAATWYSGTHSKSKMSKGVFLQTYGCQRGGILQTAATDIWGAYRPEPSP